MINFLRVLITFLLIFTSSFMVLADKIKNINVEGNQRIEKSTIAEYLSLKKGDEYSEAKKSYATKTLYATTLFEKIEIYFKNGDLTVQVKETPFVAKIDFSGNHKIKTELLSSELQTYPGENLRNSWIEADVQRIKEIYKRSGRFLTKVTSKIEKLENNRVKVIFNINEGPKIPVKQINFVGNKNYKDSELKSLLQTKESRWFMFLQTNDTYDPDRIDYDKHILKQFYNSVGFADFRVISATAELMTTKEGFILTYSIDEGQKYKLGKVSIENNINHIDTSEVRKFVLTDKGKIFNLTNINNMCEKILNHLANKGYPQVNVYPKVIPNRFLAVADIIIVINKADKLFINKININGNLKTEDNVIRRQLKISEGDVYNRRKIDRADRNIRNLDYFGKMSLKLASTEKPDRYDINIDVEEKSTSSISFDAGYNTAGGPFGRISFLERNLVGTGKRLNLGVEIGNKNLRYYGGIINPNFMDKDLSLGANFFRSENGKGSGFTGGEKTKYSKKSTGGSFSLGYNIKDDLSHDIQYSIKRDELSSISESSSIFIREQKGKFTTSAISHSLTYDRTDSRIFPKNGYLITGSQELAGLGGNTKYLKHEADAKFFKSFIDNKYTVQFSASAGHIKGLGGKKIRLPDRFNLGGYNLRGFSSGGVGPRDILTKEGLGGQKFYTVSSQLSFPLGLPKEFDITGSIFVDAGSLWDADSKVLQGFYNDKSIRASFGFGVLWRTRIAPISLDWGFPIKKKKYDETEVFLIKFTTHI